jgi:ATP-binding cassette subfamily B protein
LIEAIGISLVAAIACFFTLALDDTTSVIPALGVVALGAQRLMPVAQQIYYGCSNLIGGKKSLIEILIMLEREVPTLEAGTKAVKLEKSFSLDSVSFKYPGSDAYILKDVNLTINKGDCVGIIGESGSGKSTLLNILTGLLYPTEGRFFVDGSELTRKNTRGWYEFTASVSQSVFLIDDTIAKNISFDPDDQRPNMRKIREAASIASLDDVILSWPKKYDTLVGEVGVRLSGGQRQRIGLARAFFRKPDVLLLDEVTSALDLKTESIVFNRMQTQLSEATKIIVSHNHSALSLCDYVIEVKNGSVKRVGIKENLLKK